MAANPQQSMTELTAELPPLASGAVPLQPKQSHRSRWMILGGGMAALCLCAAVCVAVAALVARNIVAEKAPVESVLDAYMKYMVAKDVASAYALFSPRAQRQTSVSRLQDLTVGNNYFVFEGYQTLTVVNLNINAAVNSNQDAAQGSVATVNGTITYEQGFQGAFNGTLEKADGRWQIYGIFVTVPPNKFPH